MEKKEKRWERRLSDAEEQFVNQNLHRIEEYLQTQTARSIASKYYTDICSHHDELVSDLYFALRRVAIGCQDYENAFVWYGPAVFSQTTEEFFLSHIKRYDKLRNPRTRKLKDKGKKILLRQRLKYIAAITDSRPFKVIDCQLISRIIRKAGLSKMQIRVFLLKARRDMSLYQISKKLKRSFSTVRTHYQRAINKLKQYIRHMHIDITDLYRNLTKDEIFELN
jgi:DNA-binding CsgD family transcriptional regulator